MNETTQEVLDGIRAELKRIADALERAHPVQEERGSAYDDPEHPQNQGFKIF